MIPIATKLSFNHVIQWIVDADIDDTAIIILSNSDILISASLLRFISNLRIKDCFCLTRHEPYYGLCKHYLPEIHQDTWIAYAGQLKKLLGMRFISLGIPGCDVAFAAEAQRIGLNLWNPCINLYTYHLHSSEFRSYNPLERISPPYVIVPECTKEEYLLNWHITPVKQISIAK
jgi:hypothetical protein